MSIFLKSTKVWAIVDKTTGRVFEGAKGQIVFESSSKAKRSWVHTNHASKEAQRIALKRANKEQSVIDKDYYEEYKRIPNKYVDLVEVSLIPSV